MTPTEAQPADRREMDELRLALDNRTTALGALHERLRQLEAEHATLESLVAEAEQCRELATVTDGVLAQQVEDLEHRLRMVDHAAGVREHELNVELYSVREQLAAATQRADAAEQHPVRQLVQRVRARLRGS